MAHPTDKNGHKKILKGGKLVVGSDHITALGGSPQQVTVRRRCGADAKPCCLTHAEIFSNDRELRKHLDDKREHLTGYWCEATDVAVQIDAMGQPSEGLIVHGLESDRESEG